MSIVNEFDCSGVALQESTKVVFMRGIDGSHSAFKYDIACTADLDMYKIRFFFNVKSLKMLIVNKGDNMVRGKSCAIMKFWLQNDLPVPSCRYLYGQDKILTLIIDEFREKLASIILDDAINS